LQGEFVALRAKSNNTSDRKIRKIRVMPKGLPLVDIAKVYFNKGNCNGGKRIA
jgi:hypothetical protein